MERTLLLVWMVAGALAMAVAAVASGCAASRPINPAFAIDVEEAAGDLERMQREPVTLDRPVVVLGGWGDIGVVTHTLTSKLRRATTGGRDGGRGGGGGDADRFMGVSFPLSFTFDAAARRLVEQVRDRYSGDDADQTVEVDVVAFSMGGLVARHAAAERVDKNGEALPRLRIARLFTISTPHRGADAAGPLLPDPRVQDMRAGSAFLSTLDEALRAQPYPITAYVRLDDPIVGEHNAAPMGQAAGVSGVYWVASRPFTLAHTGAAGDPRIVADIARRLRGERPLTAAKPTPLPTRPSIAGRGSGGGG